MKNIKIILSFILVSVFLLGCDPESADQDVSPIGTTEKYPTPTFTFSGGNTTINEKDEPVFTYNIVFDKTTNKDIDFSFKQIAGNAVLHEDYDVVNATVSAWTKTAQMQVIIHNDLVIEGTETLTLEIESGPSLANKYLVNPNTTYPAPLTITIQNGVSESLDMSFSWDQTIDGFSTTNNIDFDIYISTMPFDINDPWANALAIYDAATGNHPETLSMNINDFEDGEYVIFHDLWYNGFFGYGPEADIMVPIVATFTRGGVFETEVTQDSSQAINALSTNGFVDDNNDETGDYHNGFIAKVTISNGTFTISEYDGTEIVSGKISNTKKTPRPFKK